MKRTQLPGLDVSVYAKAVPLLLRNPSIIVVPLLMAVIGVFLTLALLPYAGGGFVNVATTGLAGFMLLMLKFFGLGAACVIADDAWRHGRASFENGWTETRRRGGDILFASLGVTLLLSVAQYAGTIVGPLALLLVAAVIVFLIWTVPAAAIGGIPGGAAIQASIDRVKESPLPAALAAVVAVALVMFAEPLASSAIGGWLFGLGIGNTIVELLLDALLQAIALGYVALILTKTYTDSAFGTRRW